MNDEKILDERFDRLIALFQKVTRLNLPRDYVELIRDIEYTEHQNKKFELCGEDKFIVHYVYKLPSSQSYDCLWEKFVLLKDFLTDGHLAIMEDPGGRLVCVACRGENFGSVFFYSGIRTAPVYLSKTLSQFIDCLK